VEIQVSEVYSFVCVKAGVTFYVLNCLRGCGHDLAACHLFCFFHVVGKVFFLFFICFFGYKKDG